METLKFVDGTVVNGHILENGDGRTIFIYLNGMSLIDGVMLFSNTENVETITAMNHGTETVYEGYTQIITANIEFGNCNLTVRRPVNAA